MKKSNKKEILIMKRKLVVQNEEGLHARPAKNLVSALNRFDSEVTMVKDDGYKVNAKSIIGVLTLAAIKGTSLLVIAEGKDAEAAVDITEKLFANGFNLEDLVRQ